MVFNYGSMGFVRGIAFDLLFCLYIVFLEPLLLPELRLYLNQSYTYKRPSYWIAFLIIAAMLCEVPGIYLKFQAIGEKMLKAGLGKTGKGIWLRGGFVIYLFHAAVGIVVAMSAFRAFGLTFHENENLFRLLFISYLVWEGIITYFIFSAKIPDGKRPRALIKNIAGETCLFIFGTIAFTITWRTNPVVITDFSSGSMLAMLFASILFLMFYLPCNLATVYDNFLTATSRRQVFYRIGSIILVVMAALFPVNLLSRGAASAAGQSAREIVSGRAHDEEYKEVIMRGIRIRKPAR